jgi:hypothetical protein
LSPQQSGVLDDNSLDLVTDIIKTVDHLLQVVVDFLPARKIHGVARLGPIVENLKAAVVDLIRAAFDLGNLQTDLIEVSRVLANVCEKWHRAHHKVCTLHDGVGQRAHIRFEAGDLEQHDRLGRLLHLVDGIVHGRDQVFDVAAVKGGNESAANANQDLAGNAVCFFFEAQDIPAMLRAVLGPSNIRRKASAAAAVVAA